MKVLFVGSSLYGSTVDLSGLDVRPPASQGQVLAAVHEGATAIGLVDGEFGQHAAVWHKEILVALKSGVTVLGASSMGALRAAECAAFGMIPIGTIAAQYLSGALDDDAAVALLMSPPELGSLPLSEPLVDAEATLAQLLRLGHIPVSRHQRLLRKARQLHFTQRTPNSICEGEADAGELVDRYVRNHVSQKRLDAELLVETLKGSHLSPDPNRFVLQRSVYWRHHDGAAQARPL